MNRKILLAIITVSLLLAGCGETGPTNTTQQSNEKSSLATTTTSDLIDYNQYVNKMWEKKDDTSNLSFTISKIGDGKITGKLRVLSFAATDQNLLSFEANFEGTINKETAECQYDSGGNKGDLRLVLKSKNEIEATITIVDKSKTTVQPPEGTFEFVPDNIKDIKGFSPIENQSFEVNLNSWGNVKFVSGKLTAGNHVPVVFYLTNKEGDILYDFHATLPYRVEVKAVSFKDANKDGLKDIIIIVDDEDPNGGDCLATAFFQKADGSFTNDPKLDQEINESGNNNDVKTVMSFLAQKF